ncbi:MAG: helix-turn-helix domain-containing protein [Gammaproteobacteria bacterium]
MLNQSVAITGDEIKRIRERLGLTQAQFGSLLNAHFVTVSRWETNQLRPDTFQVAILSELDQAASEKQLRENLKAVLIGYGIGAALYLVLRAARQG